MLFYTEELTKALADRFDNIEEIKDVASHGCSGGVSGFIYHKDTNQFFDDHEDAVEDVCYDILGKDWIAELSRLGGCLDIMSLNTTAVWFVVELYCQNVVEEAESLVDELPPESPLRLRLSTELHCSVFFDQMFA